MPVGVARNLVPGRNSTTHGTCYKGATQHHARQLRARPLADAAAASSIRLKRAIARRMTVHTTRMLQHLAGFLEKGDGPRSFVDDAYEARYGAEIVRCRLQGWLSGRPIHRKQCNGGDADHDNEHGRNEMVLVHHVPRTIGRCRGRPIRAPSRLRRRAQWEEPPALRRPSGFLTTAPPSPRLPAFRGCGESGRCRSRSESAGRLRAQSGEKNVAEAKADATFHLGADDVRIYRNTAIDRAPRTLCTRGTPALPADTSAICAT